MIQAALVLTALPGMFIQTVEMRTEGEGGHIIGEFSREPGKKQYTHQLIEAKKLPF
jgi:hypothetical protein